MLLKISTLCREIEGACSSVHKVLGAAGTSAYRQLSTPEVFPRRL
jgi:hypothetical protein